jgi:DNA repair protein RadC
MNVKLSEAEKIRVLNSDDVYGIMQRILIRANKIDRSKEHFWTIGLNTASQILYVELISMGGSRTTIAEPMQVFRVAILKGAIRLILVHNHPSGNLKPTEADLSHTDRLLQVGKIIDVEVIDHLVISEKSYYSFEDNGLLEELKKSTRYVPDYQLKAAMKKEVETAAIQQGKQEEKKAIARQMKAQGYKPEEVAALTGLTVKSIEKLKIIPENE